MDLSAITLGAACGAAAMHGLQRLREHRTEPVGLADVLLWGFMVDEGVVLQTDGSLVAGWRSLGPDLSAATTAELSALMHQVNDALLPFADNWMFHVDAIRRPAAAYPPSVFPDPVTQLIDEERRAAYARRAGQQFETEYRWVVTFLPPAEAYSRIGALFMQGGDRGGVDWGRVLGSFRTAIDGLDRRLAGRLQFERLRSDELLTHLHECLTGLPHPVRTPPHGAYLNVVLADQELVGGFEPRIGTRAVRCVAIHGFPHAVEPGHLDILNTLAAPFRWSTRVIPLGQAEAGKEIRRHQLQWFKKRKGAGAWAFEMFGGKKRETPNPDDELFVDQDARGMALDASLAAAENASGEVRFCYCTQVLVISDPDPVRADQVAADFVKHLADRGFPARVETVNAVEAFLGSLPGHGSPNLRRPLLSTRNIAALLPVTSVWPGLGRNPSPYFPPDSPPLLWAATAGSTPFRVNLHDSDVGHALVFGKTGSGKSVLLGMLTAQFQRYPNSQVFVFDVGYSMWALARAAGATHYDLAAGRADSLRFQPLARIDQTSERLWAAEWLETALERQGVTVTPALRVRLDHALTLLAGNAPGHRTLTELMVQLQQDALVAGLRPYTMTGPYGQLLDASTDDLGESRFQVFELRHLLDLDDRIVVPVLLYLFRRIEQRLDGRPSLIVIDEAWMALMHSKFGERVHQWLLQLRKSNAAVVLATQSPAQLDQLAHRHTIVDSCPTRFYLPNADAPTSGQLPLYRALGLNDRQVAIIAGATPKRHYYVTSRRGSRLFELGLGPLALRFLTPAPGATLEETKQRIESLMAVEGDHWPAAWLATHGLGDWAARLRMAYATGSSSVEIQSGGQVHDTV